MARLPQPGGDSGNWGDILNEYLSQTHKADGTIKDNAVTANALVPNSVTNATLAPGSVTTAAIASNAVGKAQLGTSLRTEVDSKITQAVADATYAPLVPRSVEIPAALGWDSINWPLMLTRTELPGMVRAHGDCSLTPEAAFDSVSTARTAPGKSVYVDAVNGLNANSGTQASPVRSIAQAITLANASELATKIWVKGGLYVRANNFNNNGASSTVDIAFIAYQGRAIVTTSDDFTATADATNINCYVTTVTANTVNKVVDITAKTQDGGYVELINVTSIEICNATPGSWVHGAGGTLAIHRHDGAAVTQTNTRYYRAQTRNFLSTNAVNVYFGGASGNDGFDLEGGSSLGVVDVRPVSVASSQKVLAASNLTARYGGGKIDIAAGRGISIDNWYGLSIFKNVGADYNQTDGFNLHVTTAVPFSGILTINCDAIDNGRIGGISCNAHTLHETAIGIDVCSRFERGHGGTIRNIGTSKALYTGSFIANDQGDTHLTSSGTIIPTAVRLDDSAEGWFDSTRTVMAAGGYEYSASAVTAKLHKRNVWPTRTPDSGIAASFDTY